MRHGSKLPYCLKTLMREPWHVSGHNLVLPSIWSFFIKQGKEEEEAIVPAMENLKFLEEELKRKKC
ncbi:hypothetical protein CK203_026412 [Vitis vinifera]|uniref:Uncharacterized protein n=1 Tax=Vitis vinifera TaxID=29760 RepID=A0A438IVQ9_VITVI|nr:hypothetical protein CK203_026412 [Vitis vinifera]